MILVYCSLSCVSHEIYQIRQFFSRFHLFIGFTWKILKNSRILSHQICKICSISSNVIFWFGLSYRLILRDLLYIEYFRLYSIHFDEYMNVKRWSICIFFITSLWIITVECKILSRNTVDLFMWWNFSFVDTEIVYFK